MWRSPLGVRSQNSRLLPPPSCAGCLCALRPHEPNEKTGEESPLLGDAGNFVRTSRVGRWDEVACLPKAVETGRLEDADATQTRAGEGRGGHRSLCKRTLQRQAARRTGPCSGLWIARQKILSISFHFISVLRFLQCLVDSR